MSVPFSFLFFLLHTVIRTHGTNSTHTNLSLCLSLSSPLALSCCCGQQENGDGTGPGTWDLETRNCGWRTLRTNNVTGVLVQYWQTVQYKERPDQEPNGSYPFFCGTVGIRRCLPCLGGAGNNRVVTGCPPKQQCRQVQGSSGTLLWQRLLDGGQAHKAQAGRSTSQLAACSLGECGDGGAR